MRYPAFSLALLLLLQFKLDYPISQLLGLLLRSQFGREYLLVTIKIHSHIPFKTTALKIEVKCEGFLPSKSKSNARACCT